MNEPIQSRYPLRATKWSPDDAIRTRLILVGLQQLLLVWLDTLESSDDELDLQITLDPQCGWSSVRDETPTLVSSAPKAA